PGAVLRATWLALLPRRPPRNAEAGDRAVHTKPADDYAYSAARLPRRDHRPPGTAVVVHGFPIGSLGHPQPQSKVSRLEDVYVSALSVVANQPGLSEISPAARGSVRLWAIPTPARTTTNDRLGNGQPIHRVGTSLSTLFGSSTSPPRMTRLILRVF